MNSWRRYVAPSCSVLAAGFTLMTLQMLLLLCFQSICGYLYRDLALMMGLFMGGIAVGAWAGRSKTIAQLEERTNRAAAVNQLLLALMAPMLLVAARELASMEGSHALMPMRILFPCMALLCAIPGGMQFALATRYEEMNNPAQKNAALLYAMDLTGGCMAALLLAGFIVPLFGFWNAAWLAAVVNLPPVLLFYLKRAPVPL
jgi:predicted membrane-bound spermidine synthase